MYTYIIRSAELYKIGKSATVEKRLRAFRTAYGVTDIKLIEG